MHENLYLRKKIDAFSGKKEAVKRLEHLLPNFL